MACSKRFQGARIILSVVPKSPLTFSFFLFGMVACALNFYKRNKFQ